MPLFPKGFFRCSPANFLYPMVIPVCLFFSLKAAAQFSPDSLPQRDPVNALRTEYLERMGEGSFLYTGVQYIRNGQKTDGFAFFESEGPLSGSVSVAGLTHPVGFLQLDLVSGKLITQNFAGTSLFVIEPSIVDSFVIDDHSFIPLPGATGTAVMHPGYYECLRAAGMTLYIYREKQLQTRPGYDLPAYVSYDHIFVGRDGVIHPVTGQKDLLDLQPERRDEVKTFLRREKLSFKKQPAETATRLFRYYQGLIK